MHLPTLIIVSLLVNLIIGSFLFALYKRKPKDRCFKYWALSCFSFVTGGIAASLRAYDFPPILTYFLADFLLVLAPALVFFGLLQFSRFRLTRAKRLRSKWLALAIAITMLITSHYPAIISTISTLSIAMVFWFCAQLMKKSVFNEPVFTGLLSSVFRLHSVIMLLQSGLHIWHSSELTTASLPHNNLYILLSHIVLTTLTALLLPWLSFLKLERKLTLKSQRDGLTGLANRSHFFTQANRFWSKSTTKPTVIMVIDIDHFKNVNDQFGHIAGDQVIRAVAKTLASTLRSHDILGRIGGEEFAVILPFQDIDSATKIGQRLCDKVRHTQVQVADNTIDVTISVGIARATTSKETLLEAFNAADQALYTSKKSGRDQLSIGEITPLDDPLES